MTLDELVKTLEHLPLIEARNLMRDAERRFQSMINEEHAKKERAIFKDLVKNVIKEGNIVVAAQVESNSKVFRVYSIGKPTQFGYSPRGYKISEIENDAEIPLPCGKFTRFHQVVMSLARYTNYQGPQ